MTDLYGLSSGTKADLQTKNGIISHTGNSSYLVIAGWVYSEERLKRIRRRILQIRLITLRDSGVHLDMLHGMSGLAWDASLPMIRRELAQEVWKGLVGLDALLVEIALFSSVAVVELKIVSNQVVSVHLRGKHSYVTTLALKRKIIRYMPTLPLYIERDLFHGASRHA